MALIFLGAFSSGYAVTAPPLFVPGPVCITTGNVPAEKWIVFEDRNGDGAYDYFTTGGCDRTVIGSRWSAAGPGPLIPGDDAVALCTFPSVGAVTYGLSSVQRPDGLYDWKLQVTRNSDNVLIGTIYRAGATLGCTLEPMDDDLFRRWR